MRMRDFVEGYFAVRRTYDTRGRERQRIKMCKEMKLVRAGFFKWFCIAATQIKLNTLAFFEPVSPAGDCC